MRRSREGARGFTLIEILVVIIVLGLLAALVGPRILGRVSEAKSATARTQIELLGLALDNYRLDNGSYPTTEQGLAALQEKPMREPIPGNWRGPHLKKALPPCPAHARPSATRRLRTSIGLGRGRPAFISLAMNSAAPPETWGVAIDVPLIVLVPPFSQSDLTATPGAIRSTSGPKLLNPAAVSDSSIAATVMTSSYAAGTVPAASEPALPAATE